MHEAYETLALGRSGFADRKHFFRSAARAMREVLVDHARKQNAAKRGGRLQSLALNEALIATPEVAAPLVALAEALARR